MADTKHQAHPGPEKPNSHKVAFRVLDAVTIGAMVGIGVYCRQANPGAGRYLGMAISSALLEGSKWVKRAMKL